MSTLPPEMLLSFEVTRELGNIYYVKSIWAVGEPFAHAPREERIEIFTDMHQLRVRILGLTRALEWVLIG